MLAPLPLRIVLSPKQRVACVTLALTTGTAFTVTETTAVLLAAHPSMLVPVIV